LGRDREKNICDLLSSFLARGAAPAAGFAANRFRLKGYLPELGKLKSLGNDA
jgi:hypothetical protein